MDERGFFDKIAADWDDNEVLSTPEKVKNILKFFNLNGGQKVLDLGTGTGVLIPYIHELIGKEGQITAVDFSGEMLKRAKKKYQHLDPSPLFLNLDFENETVPGEFDTIILYCVYPHLHQPIDTLKWLKSVNLKENGNIYIAFPCGPDFINNIHEEKHSESDILPAASKLAHYLNLNNLKATVVADTESEYIVKISKD